MTERSFVPAAGTDRLLPFYDLFSRILRVSRLHRRLLEQAAIGGGSRVLEIGCGTGNLAILAKRLNPTAVVVGIDPDPKALARASRKAARLGASVRFEQAYAERLPFPDAWFDRVLSSLMLHHLQPDAKAPALGEVRRILRPGGTLHIADFGDGEHRPGGPLWAVSRLHHALPGARRRLHGGRHGQRGDATEGEAIPRLLREAGFGEAREVASQTSILGRIGYYAAVRV